MAGSQATLIRDWKSVPPGKEKYQLYLASREWAVLKEAVRARSGGVCERCEGARASQVHHQTYERIYEEALGDLVHVCPPCHEFLSGKIDRDPKLDAPVRLLGRTIRTAYLAGKITRTTWRDQIVADGWSRENDNELREDHTSTDWGVAPDCLPIPDGRRLALTGPYWRETQGFGGHGCVAYESGPHSFIAVDEYEPGTETEGPMAALLASMIRRTIAISDLVFAWVDSPDCYGTLVEIGFACCAGITRPNVVAVASPPGFDASDHWMAFQMANIRIRADSPREAWGQLWRA